METSSPKSHVSMPTVTESARVNTKRNVQGPLEITEHPEFTLKLSFTKFQTFASSLVQITAGDLFDLFSTIQTFTVRLTFYYLFCIRTIHFCTCCTLYFWPQIIRLQSHCYCHCVINIVHLEIHYLLSQLFTGLNIITKKIKPVTLGDYLLYTVRAAMSHLLISV